MTAGAGNFAKIRLESAIVREKMGSFEPIAIVDFSKYLLGTPAEQAQCCDELVAGLKRYGFIKLINYGLDETLVWDIFEQVSIHVACKAANAVMDTANIQYRAGNSSPWTTRQRWSRRTQRKGIHIVDTVTSAKSSPTIWPGRRKLRRERMLEYLISKYAPPGHRLLPYREETGPDIAFQRNTSIKAPPQTAKHRACGRARQTFQASVSSWRHSSNIATTYTWNSCPH